MSNALHKISTLESLHAAWGVLNKKVKRLSRNNAGIDNESINSFASHLEANLMKIQRELRSGSGYCFLPLKAHLIPKPKGKFRVICVPSVRDRVVQRATLDYLAKGDKCKLENKVSYGFIKNRRVKNAVNRVKKLRSKQPWVYKTDITSCFDSINREILVKTIKKHVRYPSLQSHAKFSSLIFPVRREYENKESR